MDGSGDHSESRLDDTFLNGSNTYVVEGKSDFFFSSLCCTSSDALLYYGLYFYGSVVESGSKFSVSI